MSLLTRRLARKANPETVYLKTKARQPPHEESCTRLPLASGRSTPAGAKPLTVSRCKKGEPPRSSAPSFRTIDDRTATRTKPWRLNRLH